MKKKIKIKTIRITDFVKSRPIIRLVKVAVCLMITISSHAASVVWMDSGTDATGDLSFYTLTAGTAASDSTVSHTGPRSLKLSTGAGASTAQARRSGSMSDAGRRISFWVRFDTINTSTFARIISADGSVTVCSFVLNSTAGTISIQPTGATTVNGTKVLVANRWYRMTIAYTITNTTTFKFVLFVNGQLDITSTAGTLTNTGSGQFGVYATSTANINNWFDDLFIDDGSDYLDPGNILVTAKKPVGNNVNNYDTAVGNNPANRWENVNEVPLSIANGWQQLAIADTQENYTLQSAAVGDVDISAFPIVGRLAWIWAKETAVLGTPKIMDNGTESAITLTTSPALYTVVSTDGVYPSNAAGIGMRSAVTAAGTFLYECGTLIAYTAPVTPNAMMSFFFK